MDLNTVIVRPLITEKGTALADARNIYPFAVHLRARKDEIRRAVEHLYQVKVLRINTLVRGGKPRRLRWKRGLTKSWKVAFVKVAQGGRIDLF